LTALATLRSWLIGGALALPWFFELLRGSSEPRGEKKSIFLLAVAGNQSGRD
jgi:hypothetical protein